MSRFLNAYGLSTQVPVYVTRKYGRDGTTGHYSQSVWITLAVLWMIELNVLLWGSIGVWKAVTVMWP